MNKLILMSALALLISISSCGNGNKTSTAQSESKENATGLPANTVSSDAPETTDNTGTSAAKPVMLTKAMFLEKVYDFEKNPSTWVYKDSKPCIIDFYADWCRPCRMVAPIMEEFAAKYNGQITIYKVDTDKERELAGFFGIRSIPSVLFCPVNGKPQMTQGALPKEEFEKIINQMLLNPTSK